MNDNEKLDYLNKQLGTSYESLDNLTGTTFQYTRNYPRTSSVSSRVR